MGSDPLGILRELRDALRNPIPDVDSFVFLLSSTLQALDLHLSTSVASTAKLSEAVKGIYRLVPAVQILLLTSAVPTFLQSLDASQRALLTSFLVPLRNPAIPTLGVRRAIALISYQTFATILSASYSQITPLPPLVHDFVLSTLGSLAAHHSIDELYWAIWSSSTCVRKEQASKDDGLRNLQWEEAVKASVGIPAKVANAVGRWKAEGWIGDVPEGLVPR